MKKGRELSVGVLLLLLLGLLALQASAQAPGDAQQFPCNISHLVHTYPNDRNLLMDSFNYQTLVRVDPVLAGTPQSQRPVWQVRNFDGTGVGFEPGPRGGICRTGVGVCDSDSSQGSTQDNWVFTQHIAYLSAREVWIKVTNLAECQSNQQQSLCNINFLTIHRYDRDHPDSAAQVDTGNYNQLQQIDYPPGSGVTTTFTFRPGARQGFYLGIKDTGTCSSIRRLQVYYLVCPGAAVHLVTYPELALPPNGVTSSTTGEASCVANAELDSGESADIQAFHDGQCNYDVSCRCLEGYEENPPPSQNGGTDPATCQACSPGFYRSFLNDTCVACPSLNTVQTGANSSICPCLDGYFRAAGESAGFNCTAPPTAVRNLSVVSSSETEVVVRWEAPDELGRTDYYYSVSRSIPDDIGNFQTLNDRLTNTASNVTFRVTNLVPFTAYMIRVSVHNGVSQNDSANDQLRISAVVGITTSAPLSAGALAGICVAAGVFLLAIVLCLVLIVWMSYRTGKRKQQPVHFTLKTVAPDAVKLKNPLSRYCKNISDDLLIEHTSIRLLDVIGQGEFGVVYKAHLITPSSNTLRRMSVYRSMNRQSKQDLQVAVKTLHTFFSDKDVAALMDEFLRMKDFDHHNVLTILGVCVDAGAAPYIVMPYMSNGSLLAFVRDNRDTFVITDPLDTNVSFISTKMINICLQICKGMEYLASNNVIHRDLAARNCMITGDWVVKVADFGLSMTGYANTYTKMKKEADTKLPIKWMAPEAFDLDKFSEKSDVWSFGVTCWEVYSGGSTPYPGMNDPKTLVDFIHGGGRLDKPTSITCSDEMFELLLSCWDEGMQTRPSFSQLVQRIETVLGMVTGYVQLTEAPLQQLRALDDKDEDDEECEKVESSESTHTRDTHSDRGSIKSDDCSDVLQTNLGTAETTI